MDGRQLWKPVGLAALQNKFAIPTCEGGGRQGGEGGGRRGDGEAHGHVLYWAVTAAHVLLLLLRLLLLLLLLL
jgi:hypothetical protein